jgi:hypothetical protein
VTAPLAKVKVPPAGPTVWLLVVTQATWTLATLALAVPLPFETVQSCAGLEGCVRTVTL